MTESAMPKPVYEVWSDVMNDILGLAKREQVTEGGNFMYRGIDALMNVCGPVFRQHGIMVVPSVQHATYRDVQTSRGKPAREVTVTVDYTIYGPAGDAIYGRSAGESMDNGDKGTAKAMSVAFRVFLLQSLCLPTDEPDPDSTVYERAGTKPAAQLAQETADRVPSGTGVEQMLGVKRWAADRNLLDLNVTDAEGNSRPLVAVIDDKITELDPTIAEDRAKNVDASLGGTS